MEIKTMADVKNEIGNPYGKLTVVERYLPNTTAGLARWLCECECGTMKVVDGRTLRQGKCISCGCEKGKKKGQPIVPSPHRTNRTGKILDRNYTGNHANVPTDEV
jgi:hypothetical protein